MGSIVFDDTICMCPDEVIVIVSLVTHLWLLFVLRQLSIGIRVLGIKFYNAKLNVKEKTEAD